MRNLLIAAGLVLLPSLSLAGWATAGLQTNPAANAVLADTGALPPQSLNMTMFCSCTVACTVVLEHRNAANNANVVDPLTGNTHAQGFFIGAQGSQANPFPQAIFLEDQERVRLRLNTAITGAAWCSITF